MKNSQALEIAESVFADAIKRRLVGGDYEEQALKTIRAALATPVGWRPKGTVFDLGDRVFKVRGSNWEGHVVGFYSTSLTPIGYAIESENEKGSVQIYPESAIALSAPPHTEGR